MIGEVDSQSDLEGGILSPSKKALRPSMAEIFVKLDEAGSAAFLLERDDTLPLTRDAF